MDGLIDTVVAKHGLKLFYVQAGMIGINILTTGGGNRERTSQIQNQNQVALERQLQ